MKTHDNVMLIFIAAMALTIFYLVMERQSDREYLTQMESWSNALLDELVMERQRVATKVVIEELIIDGDTLVSGRINYEAFYRRMDTLGMRGDSIVVGSEGNLWMQTKDGQGAIEIPCSPPRRENKP